jgi:phasin family protein
LFCSLKVDRHAFDERQPLEETLEINATAHIGQVFHLQELRMNKVEQIQQTTKDFGDATRSSANNFATSFQTIASAHVDFAKKLMQHNSEFISQLATVREPAKLMALQSEYIKDAQETFVAESKRIAELYAGLFKQTTKPLEDLIAKNRVV